MITQPFSMDVHSPNFSLEDEIDAMRREMNAVILAHYYQEDDLQDIADFVGDSLDLSRKAAETDADVIVFCGVRFMAEVAKILSPEKTVLVPDMTAGCSLEDSCPPAQFKAFIDQHPDHTVISYINCSAEVKAMTDIIVTSSNAEYILSQLPEDEKIIFAPDQYLGSYLNDKTGRDMLLWKGSCMVHELFSEKELVKLKTRHPEAKVIAHPECPPHLLNYADYVGSTRKLIEYARDHNPGEFIVLTEQGIFKAMKEQAPESTFHQVPGVEESEGSCTFCNTCPHMKKNTMDKLHMAMKTRSPELLLPENIRMRAEASLQRMLAMSA